MDRAQAFRTLNLRPTADAQMVADAYWRMVRIAQSEGETADGQVAIEQLNDAYATLNPKSAPPRPASVRASAQAQDAEGTGVWVLDVLADWIVAQAHLTRARWPGRNLEIGLLGGASMFLMLLALGSGASLLLTFAAAVVALVSIWAPWRRLD